MYNWSRHLQPGEKLELSFGVGKRYLKFMLILGLITLPIILGLFILGRYFFLRYGLKYAFTSSRLLTKEGWFVTHLKSIDYDQITDIRTHENFIDKFVTHTGTLIINTSGRTIDEVTINEVAKPQDKLHHLYRLMEHDSLHRHEQRRNQPGRIQQAGQSHQTNK